MSVTNVPEAAARQQQDIQSIQKTILEGMYTSQESGRAEATDHYREELVKKIDTNGLLWAIRLLWIPADTDFIFCAYRSLLGRAPDHEGFVQFSRNLAIGKIRRSEILMTFIDSSEAHESNRHLRSTNRVRFLLRFWHLVSRIPLIYPTLHTVWRIATMSEQVRRMQFKISQLEEQLAAVNLRSVDTIEYLHNNDKK